jgi:hypothetical protein
VFTACSTSGRKPSVIVEQVARDFTVGLADALIAATCILRGLTLVTYNLADFEKIAGRRDRAVATGDCPNAARLPSPDVDSRASAERERSHRSSSHVPRRWLARPRTA